MSALAGAAAEGLKNYRRGTDRILPPEATLARVRPLLPVMGITRIANVTGLDRIGIPVVMVSRPNSRSISVSQGKGLDLAAAKASGVMEAIETYHAETITLPLKFASFGELCYSHRMIDVAGLPFCAGSRWRDDLAMLWIEGADLMSGEPVWLPYELVSTNYTLPLPPGSGCFAANTNGLASGNSLGEAICHGLCELIERDATTLWRVRSAAARRARAIDPATIEDVDGRDLLHRFERADVAVRIWDVTTDIGVACFQCLIMGSHAHDADPEFGAGCHPRREVALCRALTEAAQARTTYIVGARDDLASELYDDEVRARRAEEARELFEGAPPAGDFALTPSWDADTIEDDIEEILHRLRQVGLHEVALVELTKPAFRLPVARLVVPGLEGAYHEVGDYLAGPRALGVLGAEGEPG
jgi:YcaO-like protein with predicted kinase domain